MVFINVQVKHVGLAINGYSSKNSAKNENRCKGDSFDKFVVIKSTWNTEPMQRLQPEHSDQT
jgi:hypothetical protein